MEALFQMCLVFGGAVLAIQVVLTMFGLGDTDAIELDAGDADVDVGDGDADAADGLNLLSVRAISAGVALFGAGGLGFMSLVPPVPAAALATIPAGAGMVSTAWLTRQMLRMQSSGTLRIANVVGREATVYLTVPPASLDDPSHGLVHVSLQGRTVELKAVTREARPLTSGGTVVILSVSDDDTVEVVPTSTFEEMIDDDRA